MNILVIEDNEYKYEYITDDEAAEAVFLLSRLEGIIPAIESAHAVAYLEKLMPNTKEDEISLVLLGNKCDSDQRTVSDHYGLNKAKELKIKYFETSALNGTNINEAFIYLTQQIMLKRGDNKEQMGGAQLSATNQTKKDKGCC